MIDKPIRGWCLITIGEWHDFCSEMDDVPYKLYEAMEVALRTFNPAAVKLGFNDYKYTIVFDQNKTHIISDKEAKTEYITVAIDLKELARDFILDVVTYLDDWVKWCTITDDEYEERKKDLEVMCQVLERRCSWWEVSE